MRRMTVLAVLLLAGRAWGQAAPLHVPPQYFQLGTETPERTVKRVAVAYPSMGPLGMDHANLPDCCQADALYLDIDTQGMWQRAVYLRRAAENESHADPASDFHEMLAPPGYRRAWEMLSTRPALPLHQTEYLRLTAGGDLLEHVLCSLDGQTPSCEVTLFVDGASVDYKVLWPQWQQDGGTVRDAVIGLVRSWRTAPAP